MSYNNDSLSVVEMHKAFENVYRLSDSEPPIDILGFDCCDMASLDVADTFKDTAHYLIASEDKIYGSGFNYNEIGNSLGSNPKMSPSDLGVRICDSYYDKMDAYGHSDTATLSLTDLSKIGKLTAAMSAFGDEMITKAYGDPQWFKTYAMYADSAENYSGNSQLEGYSDLIDVKSFAENANGDFESAADVINAVDECVLYKVRGDYRQEGGGLSFYFDCDGKEEKNNKYKENGTIEALKVLYDFGVSGTLDEAEKNYMVALGLNPDHLPMVKEFKNFDFGRIPIKFEKNGQVYIQLDKNERDCAVNAFYSLHYHLNGKNYYIGSDDDIEWDHSTGVIREKMSGKWGFFDGNIACMRLTYASDDYNLYSVPIRVKGEKMFLQVGYDYDTKAWELLGTSRNNGPKALTGRTGYIEDGTEVTLILYEQPDTKLIEVDGGTFIYNDKTSFEYAALEEGEYSFNFELEDLYKNRLFSKNAIYYLKDGTRTYKKK